MASSNIVRQSYCGKHNVTFGERYQPIVNEPREPNKSESKWVGGCPKCEQEKKAG